MRIFWLLLILLMVSCSNSKPETIKHYQLLKINSMHENLVRDKKILLNSVKLADFLNREGIVYQISDVEISSARQSLWASNIKEQIINLLVFYLENQGFTVIDSNSSNRQDVVYVVDLNIQKFQGSFEGVAQLSGKFTVSKQNTSKNVNFDIEESLTQDGYPEVVKALSKNIAQLSFQIGNEI